MSELMENHINDLELQIAQLETAVKCYIVDIDIQKQKNKALQNRIDKAIEYFTRRDIEWGSYEQKVLLDILRGNDE